MSIHFSRGAVESWSYAEANGKRSGFQEAFCEWLMEEHGIRGKVFDVGCGVTLPSVLHKCAERCGQLDGVDPDAFVAEHPYL